MTPIKMGKKRLNRGSITSGAWAGSPGGGEVGGGGGKTGSADFPVLGSLTAMGNGGSVVVGGGVRGETGGEDG